MLRTLASLFFLLVATPSSLFAAKGPEDNAVFDVHVHLHDGEASLKRYEADATEAGIAVSCIAAMWFGGPNQALHGRTEETRRRNDGIIRLARQHPDLLPIATVHPYDGRAALQELSRVAAAGIRILKLHAHTQIFDVQDPRVLQLVTRAGELGLTVLMDNAGILPGDSEKLFNLAAQAPGTRFIFAHMGAAGFRFWNILALARTADGFALDNVYFDISGALQLAADTPLEAEFVWTLRNVGLDSVLLGSDYPQLPLAKALEALDRLDLTSEEKRKIRIGNARRLFNR